MIQRLRKELATSGGVTSGGDAGGVTSGGDAQEAGAEAAGAKGEEEADVLESALSAWGEAYLHKVSEP